MRYADNDEWNKYFVLAEKLDKFMKMNAPLWCNISVRYSTVYGVYMWNENWEEEPIDEVIIISKKFWFIEWLYKTKQFQNEYNRWDYEPREYIIMILSVSDAPIERLASLIKIEE